jgi:hypothetical protein
VHDRRLRGRTDCRRSVLIGLEQAEQDRQLALLPDAQLGDFT